MPTSRQLFLQHLAPTNDIPLMLEIERALGHYLYDAAGKKYFDLICGIGVSSLGHGHPDVLAAIHEQAERYLHVMVYGEFIQNPQVAYAQALTEALSPGLDAVYFTNSGTEATEGAMKLAKRVTGRPEFVAAHNAYHGSTQGALALAGGEWFRRNYRPLPGPVRNIRYNCVHDLRHITQDTAAVVLEAIQGEAGALPPLPGYLQAVRQRCDEVGAWLILDEIQSGMGRTGTLFAFQQENIAPDVLLLGKALGAGMPLGAFIASRERMQQLAENPVLGHITTFGGHPVSCAAGLAGWKVLQQKDYIARAQEKGDLLAEGLCALPGVHQVSGRGLLRAVHVGSFARVQQTIYRLLEQGFVSDWFLFNDQAIRLAPPLTITEDEIDDIIYGFQKALKSIAPVTP